MSKKTLDEYVEERREAQAEKKKNSVLEEWLRKRFRVEGTKKNYRIELFTFLQAIYGENQYDCIHKVGEGIDRYLSEQRNFLEDFNNFLLWMNSKKFPPTSIHRNVCGTKKFFRGHGHKISDEQWEDIATLLPANVVVTQDDILTKEQFRAVLNHLSIHGKALVLFLLSTGARIGETLKLKITDLNLDADPPSVNIRPEYTKKGVGGRVMWCSYEARDALKEWLRLKDSRQKRGGGPFPKDMVFGFLYMTFVDMWGGALEKVGLDKRDPRTGIRIYHVHTLRKFFRSRMGIAGVPDMVVHAWMGHKAYLNTYDKLGKEALGEMYRDRMTAVSVYVSDEETKRTQLRIKLEELDDYMAKGWTYKDKLPDGTVIVEGKPGMLKPTPLEPSKSEAVSPTQMTKNMPVVKEEPQQPTPPPQPVQPTQSLLAQKIQRSECLRDLETNQWDIACMVCRERFKNYYERCRVPFKEGKS